MVPADIRRQVVVEELDLSRDGRLAVVARRSIRGDRYVTHLHAIPLEDRAVAKPRQLTSGMVRDGRPRLSPDGRSVAFVRSDPTDDDAVASIVVLDLGRGRERVLPARSHGSVGEVAWSPDGQRLAFTAEVDPPRFLVGPVPGVGGRAGRGTTGGREPCRPAARARHITRADWRWDGHGHQDRWSHLFVREVRAGARSRQVTAGDWGVVDICWAPDGRTVAFSADLGPTADIRPRPTIWAVDVDAGSGTRQAEPRAMLTPTGLANHPAFSPDGRWLAAIGVLESDPIDDTSPGILVGASDGSGTPRALGAELDRPIGNWADTDLNGWMVDGRPGPFWLGNDTIVATVTDRGRSHPVRFHLDPSRPRVASGPWSDATSHALAVAPTGVIAVLGTLGTRAMELMTLDGEAEPAALDDALDHRIGLAAPPPAARDAPP